MPFSSTFPLLSGAISPDIVMQSIAMHIGWALVLGAITAFLLRPFPKRLRIAGVALIMLACLMPGEWSPTWWLGLAFQTPSLTSQGLAFLYLMRMWHLKNVPPTDTVATTAYARWPNSLLLLATALGWIFALDTFAAFDLQLYAIGFSSYAVLATLLLAAMLQLLSMRSGNTPQMQRHRDLAAILVGAMAIHLLTRLPTGNAWDALMDPWLWLSAQAIWLSRALVWLALLARVKSRQASEWITATIGKAR